MQKSKIKPRILVSADKTKSNSFLTSLFSNQRFLAIIGLVFLVLIIFPLARTYSQKRAVEKEITDVKKQISEFESTNKDLKDMIDYLNSDQSLEEEARLNLNLKKSGEQVVVINDVENKLITSSIVAPAKNKNNLAKWRDYFFN